jgi:hypothetical protein
VIGRAWVTAIAILLTPAYLGLLGIEAYGLIGVFALLQTILALFDFGLGLTLNRELAALSHELRANSQLMRDTVRTFEIVYWLVGLLIGATVIAGAPFLATTWFHSSVLSTTATTIAIALMGLAIGVQWPSWLYQGGLLGLERHVTMNGILAGCAGVRWVGALLVLRFISPTIELFFAWQIIASAIQTLVLRLALARLLPEGRNSRFDRAILRSTFTSQPNSLS